MRRTMMALAVMVAALGQAACLISIDHVADPTAAFQAARREALRAVGRPGPSHQVNVLVYDPGDSEMVRVQVPMWLVKKLDGAHGDWEGDTDSRGDEVARRVRRHLRPQTLEKAPPGLLLEVEEEDGERVLVWLR